MSIPFLIFTLYGSEPMVDLTLIFLLQLIQLILAGCLSNAINLCKFFIP
jgi:hypothetical protein